MTVGKYNIVNPSLSNECMSTTNLCLDHAIPPNAHGTDKTKDVKAVLFLDPPQLREQCDERPCSAHTSTGGTSIQSSSIQPLSVTCPVTHPVTCSGQQ